MRVLIVANAHLYKTPNGDYYSPSVYGYQFLSRYLKVFDTVRLLAKVKYLLATDDISHYHIVSGPNVEIIELPWYQGLKQMIGRLFTSISIYFKASYECDCYIYRVAQVESFLAFLIGRKKGIPFGVEVVNDPYTFNDIFPPIKWLSILILKYMTKKANGASYVTEYTLQNKFPSHLRLYPKNQQYFETHYSSIDLDDGDIAKQPICYQPNETFKIIHLANAIHNDNKGHTTLIKAAKRVIDQGYDITVTCIGDGSLVKKYQNYITELNISHRIKFIGKFNHKHDILNALSHSHLLVMPTKMEGLPRSVIEAMAVGLPCISTPIAGIPELLSQNYLFVPDHDEDFAKEIIRLINHPNELYQMSQDNLTKASQYTSSILERRRTEFYRKLYQCAKLSK